MCNCAFKSVLKKSGLYIVDIISLESEFSSNTFPQNLICDSYMLIIRCQDRINKQNGLEDKQENGYL